MGKFSWKISIRKEQCWGSLMSQNSALIVSEICQITLIWCSISTWIGTYFHLCQWFKKTPLIYDELNACWSGLNVRVEKKILCVTFSNSAVLNVACTWLRVDYILAGVAHPGCAALVSGLIRSILLWIKKMARSAACLVYFIAFASRLMIMDVY